MMTATGWFVSIIAADNFSGQVMTVVVVMGIHGQSLRIFFAKQFQVGGVIADLFGMAMATDMLVQANNFVSSRHDQVQVM